MLRKLKAISNAETGRAARIYRDAEWQEYRVKFSASGEYLGEAADYHTDDKADAELTAAHWVNSK